MELTGGGFGPAWHCALQPLVSLTPAAAQRHGPRFGLAYTCQPFHSKGWALSKAMQYLGVKVPSRWVMSWYIECAQCMVQCIWLAQCNWLCDPPQINGTPLWEKHLQVIFHWRAGAGKISACPVVQLNLSNRLTHSGIWFSTQRALLLHITLWKLQIFSTVRIMKIFTSLCVVLVC